MKDRKKQDRVRCDATLARSLTSDVAATQSLPLEEVQHERENAFVD